jgi:hypothetical protein
MWLDLQLLTFNRQKSASLRTFISRNKLREVDQQNRTANVTLSDMGAILGVSYCCSLPNLPLSLRLTVGRKPLTAGKRSVLSV